jgi:hypothetical protein
MAMSRSLAWMPEGRFSVCWVPEVLLIEVLVAATWGKPDGVPGS